MELKEFSNLNRPEITSALKKTEYDLVVIGGGITGAGILLDAASRGLKVALVEKGDFASGTSSKSTKLIHGGLRYLKQFDFGLVKEVGTERAIVHNLAPHLVLPEKMLLPLIEKGSYGKWLTSIGLKIYDLLAQVDGEDQRKMLDKEETLALEPLLPEKILKGAGYYAEYRTDDARLTLENIKTALNYEATALNYIKATNFLYENGLVKGVKVEDILSRESYTIKAKYIINATGPWVDDIRTVNKSKNGHNLFLTKGVHLVFAHEKIPVRQSVYFDAPDGRMIFAIPRGKITYVGTTDTPYPDDKNDVYTNPTDAFYLIKAVNYMFPTLNLTLNDIQSSWAGLRPLIHEEGKSATELSRKDEIFESESGLLSIAGGKLTGYRKMAERVLDRAVKKLNTKENLTFGNSKTHEIPLCGGPWESFAEVKAYSDQIFTSLDSDGFTKRDAWYLTTTYGKQMDIILDLFNHFEDDDAMARLLKAEFHFTIKYELLQNPLDFFIRRTGRMYFDIDSVKKYSPMIVKEYQTVFQLKEEDYSFWMQRILEEIGRHGVVEQSS
ncbi:glycerol-3-phosphate dehydrogenase/oxidase [Galbibacter mesophilus]|uniref:glycerol-3-phosphate dehydrogenase/oxidase n=1 Tax=Galbibacter mesophilus TaxID=379069 RepID=UPI00191D1C0C|nr:glycerol-3-phosphate dehydrogenase/oxidase [Galbibacter mesophilus]MCM5662425.1 glycerol-3-phosphate dehydrogenase/oxidase [Galbibacter mesophilus]